MLLQNPEKQASFWTGAVALPFVQQTKFFRFVLTCMEFHHGIQSQDGNIQLAGMFPTTQLARIFNTFVGSFEITQKWTYSIMYLWAHKAGKLNKHENDQADLVKLSNVFYSIHIDLISSTLIITWFYCNIILLLMSVLI